MEAFLNQVRQSVVGVTHRRRTADAMMISLARRQWRRLTALGARPSREKRGKPTGQGSACLVGCDGWEKPLQAKISPDTLALSKIAQRGEGCLHMDV